MHDCIYLIYLYIIISNIDNRYMSQFLKTSIDELFNYYTPKAVIEIVEKEKIKSLIQNPPYAPSKSNK